MALINFDRVTKKFTTNSGKTNVLEELSFEIEKSKFYSIFGPSGCGKTTILNLIAGLLSQTSGLIKISWPIEIGYVFQEDRLFPWLKIWENLDIILKRKFKLLQERKEIIKKYLNWVDLSKSFNKYPLTLSSGERQRINIVRAFCNRPDVILMDEPFAHIDEITASRLRKDLLNLLNKQPTTVIFVTHNLHEAVYLSDKLFLLSQKPVMRIKTITLRQQKANKVISYENFINQEQTLHTIRKIQKELSF